MKAWILTVLSGLLGIYIGALLNMEGYLGSVFAIATMGYFIINAIEKKK